jgi:thimet oligopeptidase
MDDKMKHKKIIIWCAFFIICVVSYVRVTPVLPQELYNVISIRDVVRLFPQNASQIEKKSKLYIRQAKKRIKSILEVLDKERSFENTVKPLDNVLGLSDFAIAARVIEILEMVSPQEDIREAAHEASAKIKAYVVDVMSNKKLYEAFKAYVDGNMQHETLTDEQQYFLDEKMKEFKRNGLELSDDQLSQVKQLKKEINQLSQVFAKNIATDNSAIIVSKDELAGLSNDFIDGLKVTRDGNYVVGVDYPTYHNVMQNCTNAQTRKKLYLAFSNRAYPANEPILKSIITKRDQLAKLLGFESYAQLDLDNQMVQSPERAQSFLNHLIMRASKKEAQEFADMAAALPASVELVENKLYPWDIAFVKEQYKKQKFAVDELEIAEYFPVEKTIEGLLSIYESFFSLRFEEVVVHKLWSNDVRALKVYDVKTDQLLGYILMDLYPRKNKYSHACNITIVPTVFGKDGKPNVGVSAIVANFPKAQGDKPPLLKRADVQTFFHEFGHALHGILGRTHMASLSGYETKIDFVELPSQMLEEWLWDKDMLKLVSEHYQTGEPLSDDLIDKILAVKHIDTGSFVQRQSFLALLSLAYHLSGEDKDVQEIQKKLREEIIVHQHVIPEAHFFASFGHLTEYAAKYYGYLWSKVFALDIFAQIKKDGLLNPEIGQKYINCVIGRGGSVDPNVMLRDFLGREPNDKAFFADMGL